ncbi:MAG: hypothetical protein JWR19_218 [Pedosphaera sp.]|nr:hypothetical protein [Pedosphaera sp.]
MNYVRSPAPRISGLIGEFLICDFWLGGRHGRTWTLEGEFHHEDHEGHEGGRRCRRTGRRAMRGSVLECGGQFLRCCPKLSYCAPSALGIGGTRRRDKQQGQSRYRQDVFYGTNLDKVLQLKFGVRNWPIWCRAYSAWKVCGVYLGLRSPGLASAQALTWRAFSPVRVLAGGQCGKGGKML